MDKQKQKRLDRLYMDIALRVAKESKATRKKVGSIIVKDNNIISFGWNGTPTGFDNSCEINNTTKREVLHAESNALTKLLKSDNMISTNGSTLYVTLSPCFECAKLVYQSGISRVVYLEEYRNLDSLIFLNECGVELVKLKEEEH